LAAQEGVQPSLPASIFAPGPLKSVTLPVRDQPAGPPRKSLTVTVWSLPVEAPPWPKSTPASATESPAWDMASVPALTLVVSFWLPGGTGVVSLTT
jgi:hypothetical protein